MYACPLYGVHFRVRKSVRLDVDAVEAMEKVQKEREKAADWTLKWLGGRLKSKRDEKERWIGR